MSWTKLDALVWANRSATEFYSAMIGSSDVLKRFSVYDGIKSKGQVPIFEATLTYDDHECTWSPGSSADVSEKEFTVHFKRWGLTNCKNALESTFRSLMLTKGQLNEQTLDDQFKEWVFDYFVMKNAENMVEWSWSGDSGDIDGIKVELLADTTITKVSGAAVGTTHTLTNEEEILTHMKAAVKGLSDTNKKALYGGATQEFKPAFFVNYDVYQAYQLAIAEYGQEYAGIEKGLLKTFLGMEVIPYAPLADNEMMLTVPSNLVIVTDNLSDADAIQAEYDKKTNSDNIWGQFKVGFSYKKGSEVTIYHTASTWA